MWSIFFLSLEFTVITVFSIMHISFVIDLAVLLKCHIQVWISKQMNNHSFLPSFIPLFLPSSSAPLQVLFIPPIPLESFKIKVNHFLYVDKVNSRVFDFAITRPLGNITHGWSCPPLLETCSFPRLQHAVLTCVFLYFHCLLSVYFLVYTVFAGYQTFE